MPVLAHELGHVDTLDGRLTEALGRMVLWEDPLGPLPRGDRAAYEPEEPHGFLFGAIRWALRLVGGTMTQQLLSPLGQPTGVSASTTRMPTRLSRPG